MQYIIYGYWACPPPLYFFTVSSSATHSLLTRAGVIPVCSTVTLPEHYMLSLGLKALPTYTYVHLCSHLLKSTFLLYIHVFLYALLWFWGLGCWYLYIIASAHTCMYVYPSPPLCSFLVLAIKMIGYTCTYMHTYVGLWGEHKMLGNSWRAWWVELRLKWLQILWMTLLSGRCVHTYIHTYVCT